MPTRNIIRIDESKCNGCGQCIVNCPEGALQIVDGKARLVRESYCDGLGACLGTCPTGALSIERRGADAFDQEAVRRHMACDAAAAPETSGCPSLRLVQLGSVGGGPADAQPTADSGSFGDAPAAGQLRQWPIQLALVPPGAPFLREAELVLAADCVPFAMADFHARLLRGRALAVACPKLDDRAAQVAKLRAIFEQAGPRRVTIVHMEVPCCRGLLGLVGEAMAASGRQIPVCEMTVGLDGRAVTAPE
jgi:NAD-dependent dihydropyrimidine dehydrogenase PreA subunit